MSAPYTPRIKVCCTLYPTTHTTQGEIDSSNFDKYEEQALVATDVMKFEEEFKLF